ncbi:MAG TPA: PadR family transcriptional regulator [Thermoplasmata archaeon]|nr:PadR family transcriptional regulator [Thermoplasmata archaeon]
MWPFRWMMHQRRGLRVGVLVLLSGGPKNGAELIAEVENLTGGWWRPSPGSVYPLLDQLLTDGLIAKRPDGRYELTPKAEEEVGWPLGTAGSRRSPASTLDEIEAAVAYLEDAATADPGALGPVRPRMKELAGRVDRLARGGVRPPDRPGG